MNAVIYARYSSDNQREESIEGQLRDCREYAERNNLTIVGNYIDRALSARTADRPDFQRMIHDSEKRLFDVVLVWKLDRFSRDRYDSAHYKHILKKNGVRVVSAKEAIADGPEGIILESMLEGMAEYYSAELAVKVRRGQRENAMKCRNNGGTLAYGYSVNKETGALVVNPKTAPIVREIFSRYDKGELIKNIVKDLNARGLRNNFNRPFQASAMTLLLKNRKYIGDYCYGDMIIPGGVPALVEKDVFERVQRRMEANKKSPGRAKAKEEYLLSGKVFCGTCGGHMVGECGKSRNGTIYYYYKCINAKHGHTCKRKAIKRDWLERAVVVETVTKVLTDEVIDRVADAIIAIQGQENPMIPSIKEQLRACDNSLKNLLKAIEAGIFTPTTKERMEELERQKEELNVSLIRAQMAQPVFTKEEIVKWISRFKYGSINDKTYQREIIDTFLNSVYVYDDRIVFTYNFRDHAETVTLDEIEYVFCSDVNDCPPVLRGEPVRAIRRELFLPPGLRNAGADEAAGAGPQARAGAANHLGDIGLYGQKGHQACQAVPQRRVHPAGEGIPQQGLPGLSGGSQRVCPVQSLRPEERPALHLPGAALFLHVRLLHLCAEAGGKLRHGIRLRRGAACIFWNVRF